MFRALVVQIVSTTALTFHEYEQTHIVCEEKTEEEFSYEIFVNSIQEDVLLEEHSGKNPTELFLKYLPAKNTQLQFFPKSSGKQALSSLAFCHLKVPLYLLFKVILL